MGEVEQLCAVVDAMLVCGPLSGDDAGGVVPKRVSRDGKAAVTTALSYASAGAFTLLTTSITHRSLYTVV